MLKLFNYNWALSAVTVYLSLVIRYLIIAGMGFFVFWKWKRTKFQKVRIQQLFPEKKKVWNEFRWSFSTFIIFTAVITGITYLRRNGHTLIYSPVSKYG